MLLVYWTKCVTHTHAWSHARTHVWLCLPRLQKINWMQIQLRLAPTKVVVFMVNRHGEAWLWLFWLPYAQTVLTLINPRRGKPPYTSDYTIWFSECARSAMSQVNLADHSPIWNVCKSGGWGGEESETMAANHCLPSQDSNQWGPASVQSSLGCSQWGGECTTSRDEEATRWLCSPVNRLSGQREN
jgi:hypothetical protein